MGLDAQFEKADGKFSCSKSHGGDTLRIGRQIGPLGDEGTPESEAGGLGPRLDAPRDKSPNSGMNNCRVGTRAGML